jgi:hypothetical protein
MLKVGAFLSAISFPSVALAGIDFPPVDLSGVNATLATMQASIPVPASSVPPTEQVTPTVGTPGTYRPYDAVQPRITRAGSCTLITGGTCTVTWATPFSVAPNVVLSPINTAGAQPMSCNPTSAPTTTSVAIKCWLEQTTTLSLAIVTTGLTLAPAQVAPAGTVVQATGIPPTQ